MMKFISLEDLISRLESSLVEMNTKCSEITKVYDEA